LDDQRQGCSDALQKGLAADPNNPRLYYLRHEPVRHSATIRRRKGQSEALFEKSVALFKAAQPKPLIPTWGQKQAEDMLLSANNPYLSK